MTDVLIPADVRFPLERANGIQIVKTAAALADAGARATLVVRRSDPRGTPEILALFGVPQGTGLHVRRLRVLHRRGSFLVPRLSFLSQAAALSWWEARRGAVVYTRDLHLAALLLRLGVRRLVYEAHAVEAEMYSERGQLYGTAEKPKDKKASRIFEREARVWKGAAGIVTTTAGIAESFAERYGGRERVAVIPNGCDVPEPRVFPELPRSDPPRIVYAGQLYPWKGVDALVEAVSQVPSARLVILGGIPAEGDLARIQALVEKKGLLPRTEMKGTLPQVEVQQELRRASVVAVPFLKTAMTERHTSPIKAFEAMAAGRPVVVSDVPSSREFLRDGDNALLVPPGDVPAWAAALRRLLDDPVLAGKIARQAFEDAAKYSWRERAKRLLVLFGSGI